VNDLVHLILLTKRRFYQSDVAAEITMPQNVVTNAVTKANERSDAAGCAAMAADPIDSTAARRQTKHLGLKPSTDTSGADGVR
jgi:hypothetical protein